MSIVSVGLAAGDKLLIIKHATITIATIGFLFMTFLAMPFNGLWQPTNVQETNKKIVDCTKKPANAGS